MPLCPFPQSRPRQAFRPPHLPSSSPSASSAAPAQTSSAVSLSASGAAPAPAATTTNEKVQRAADGDYKVANVQNSHGKDKDGAISRPAPGLHRRAEFQRRAGSAQLAESRRLRLRLKLPENRAARKAAFRLADWRSGSPIQRLGRLRAKRQIFTAWALGEGPLPLTCLKDPTVARGPIERFGDAPDCGVPPPYRPPGPAALGARPIMSRIENHTFDELAIGDSTPTPAR